MLQKIVVLFLMNLMAYFEEICKMVASRLQNISFNGIAHYSNFSTNYEVYNIITYRCRKKEILIKNISGEYLDGYYIKCANDLSIPRKVL